MDADKLARLTGLSIADVHPQPRQVELHGVLRGLGLAARPLADDAEHQGDQDVYWLMRVPETLVQTRQRVKDTLDAELCEIETGYKGKEVECEYAGIKQRWLVVFSEAAQMRELKTLEKTQAKELEAAQKEWRKFEGQTFNCMADAEQAVAQFNKKWKYHQATAQANAITQYARRGRPTAEDQKEVVGYNLQGRVEVSIQPQWMVSHARSAGLLSRPMNWTRAIGGGDVGKLYRPGHFR